MLDTYLLAMQDAENYLTFLHSLSDMGAAMRRVMANTLTDKNLYKTLINMHVDPGRIITSPVHSGTGYGQKPFHYKMTFCPSCKIHEGAFVLVVKFMKGLLSAMSFLDEGAFIRRGCCPTLQWYTS